MKCHVAFGASLLLMVAQTATAIYHACNPNRPEFTNKHVFGRWTDGKFYSAKITSVSGDKIVVKYLDKLTEVLPLNRVKIATRTKAISPNAIADCKQAIYCVDVSMWGGATERVCSAPKLKWKGDDDKTKRSCSSIEIIETEVSCDAANPTPKKCTAIGTFPDGVKGGAGVAGCIPDVRLELGQTCELECESEYTAVGQSFYRCGEADRKPETDFSCKAPAATTSAPGSGSGATTAATGGDADKATTGSGSDATTAATGSDAAGGNGDKAPTGGDGPGASIAIVIIVVLVVLGGAGFAVYWFVIRNRLGGDKEKTPGKSGAHHDVEMGKTEHTDTRSKKNATRRVSKPVLTQVNGSDVEGKDSDSDDTTIDDSDEENRDSRKPPPVPSQPKPRVPTKDEQDYQIDDYGETGTPKRAPDDDD